MTVIEYLKEHLEKTGGWQFMKTTELYGVIPYETAKIELNQLVAEGKIRKRKGYNVALIEIINLE